MKFRQIECATLPLSFLPRKLASNLALLLLTAGLVPFVSAQSNRPNPSHRISYDAAQFMPRSFQKLLPKYSVNLENGISKFPSQPYFMGQKRVELEVRLLSTLEGAVRLLRGKSRLALAIEEMGSLAEMVLLLNLPELREADPESHVSLKNAIEINRTSFPLVLYDANELGRGLDPVKELLVDIRGRRTLLTGRYADFISTKPPLDLNLPLDPKSAAFGILSPVYSHTVNDLARLWLWIWRSAGGDMTGSPLVADSTED